MFVMPKTGKATSLKAGSLACLLSAASSTLAIPLWLFSAFKSQNISIKSS